MKRLTAQEAKKLAGLTAEEQVDAALAKVEGAAKNSQRFINLHDKFWVDGGYDNSKEWVEAKRQLVELGYTVEFFYEEKQFVNMYTIIKW